MSRYRIICTIQNPPGQPHSAAHIVQVGTGDSTGWNRQWTVDEVYRAMDLGDVFYTYGERSGKTALVHKFCCPDCGFRTLRSAPDAVTDNNLDNLPRCQR